MPKDSSAEYYQIINKYFKKKALERYQTLFKEEKEKSNNMVGNNTKIHLKMKNKSFLSIEKNIIK